VTRSFSGRGHVSTLHYFQDLCEFNKLPTAVVNSKTTMMFAWHK